MAKKRTTWHTDIVVGGQGIGIKIAPARGGCHRAELMSDVPGAASTRARKRFKKAMGPPGCSAVDAKRQVERAVKATRARWNKWHREAY